MFEMKGECKRNTGGSRREERRGAREADGRQAGYGVGPACIGSTRCGIGSSANIYS